MMLENQFEWLQPDIKLLLDSHAPEIETDNCINWSGLYLSERPAVRVAGSTRSATRLVYQRSWGQINQSIIVVNTCGNTGCVNPKHMKGVTRSEIAKKAAKR
jgi:hypothetical protein